MSKSVGGNPVTCALETSSRMSGFSAWKSRSIGRNNCCNKDGGTCSRSDRPVSSSSRIEFIVCSMRSRHLLTTGNNSSPAAVRESFAASRTNSCLPSNSSSPPTCLLIALCDTDNADAPPVKLRCCPTASKARKALSGSQRRLIVLRLEMTCAFPFFADVHDLHCPTF